MQRRRHDRAAGLRVDGLREEGTCLEPDAFDFVVGVRAFLATGGVTGADGAAPELFESGRISEGREFAVCGGGGVASWLAAGALDGAATASEGGASDDD